MFKRCLFILLLTGYSFMLMQAQTMKIKMNTGAVVTYNIGDIEIITFSNLTSSSELYETDFPPVSSTSITNYPNPFNSATTIFCSIPESGDATITISDLKGRLVKTIAMGKIPAGDFTCEWDGRNEADQEVMSGLYIYAVFHNGKVQHNKMLLLKK